MDKNFKTIIILMSLVVLLAGILEGKKQITSKYNDKLDKIILNHSWERDGGGDIETIYFKKDGKFGYYCSCGNPVDDYDLCDSYKYDKETNTIKLKCSLGVDVTELKIKKVTDYELVIDFNGEERTFKSELSYLLDNPLEFAGEKLVGTKKDNIKITFNIDGTFDAYDTKKSEYAYGSDYCFYWEYDEDKKEISLDCQGEGTRIIDVKEHNQKTKEVELYFRHEKEKLTLKYNK